MNRLIIIILVAITFIGCSDPDLTRGNKKVSKWIKQLNDQDEEKVLEAIYELGEIGPDAYPARIFLIAMMSKHAADTDHYFSGDMMIAINDALQKIDPTFQEKANSRLNDLE